MKIAKDAQNPCVDAFSEEVETRRCMCRLHLSTSLVRETEHCLRKVNRKNSAHYMRLFAAIVCCCPYPDAYRFLVRSVVGASGHCSRVSH